MLIVKVLLTTNIIMFVTPKKYSLNDFNDLLVPGIFGIHNPDDRKVHVSTSKCLLESIWSYLRDKRIGIRGKDIQGNNLEIIVLEIVNNEDQLYPKLYYWQQYYLNLEYKLYNKKIVPKAKIVIKPKFIDQNLYMTVVHKINTIEVILGLFDNIFDAQKFVDQYYPKSILENKYCFPEKIFSINEYTSFYYRKIRAKNKFNIK